MSDASVYQQYNTDGEKVKWTEVCQIQYKQEHVRYRYDFQEAFKVIAIKRNTRQNAVLFVGKSGQSKVAQKLTKQDPGTGSIFPSVNSTIITNIYY